MKKLDTAMVSSFFIVAITTRKKGEATVIIFNVVVMLILSKNMYNWYQWKFPSSALKV
ncbi:Uncharacterised protein [Listeria grayi]|uniref:Uncharacterized protein n=1 Tax=Listeria grayi TaxID=1641 RepID=A0A378MDP4_LISGR|nr:Uncharacterised protein [Listeria grayi]